MWILPTRLHTSAFVPDTAALILDSSESSQACAQSLLVRSKPMPARTWLRKWKRDSWTRHLSGRILKASHGESFTDLWTSSLEATLASRSVQPESALAPTTPATSGHGSQTVFALCDQDSASSRTSKDTSALGSGMSLENWKASVIEQRGEYSQRLKSGRHTSGSGCSSWPTASSRDWKDSPGMASTGVNPDGTERSRIDQLPRAVYHYGRPAPVSPSTNGSRPEQWPTPRSCSAMAATITPESASNPDRFPNLETQVGKTMAVPTGVLNPDWVETLMGVPVGWTSVNWPPALTASDSLATESSQQLQPVPTPSFQPA